MRQETAIAFIDLDENEELEELLWKEGWAWRGVANERVDSNFLILHVS